MDVLDWHESRIKAKVHKVQDATKKTVVLSAQAYTGNKIIVMLSVDFCRYF